MYHALPAGVVPVQASLEELVRQNVISRFEASDGGVRFEVPPRSGARPVALAYRVVPEFSGRLASAVSWVEISAGEPRRSYSAPAVWKIAR